MKLPVILLRGATLVSCLTLPVGAALHAESNLADEVANLKKLVEEQQQTINSIQTDYSKLQGLAPSKKGNVTSNVNVGIYGFVKADMMYNDAPVNSTLLPTIASSGDGDGTFDATGRETRLGFDFSGAEDSRVKTSAKLETDFFGGGSDNLLRVRRAYVKLDLPSNTSLLFGRDWDTGGLNVVPKVLNFRFMGGAGNPWSRRAQARLTQKVSFEESTLTLEAALADSGSAIDTPMLQWNVAWAGEIFGERSTKIGFSGVYAEDEVSGETYDNSFARISLVQALTDKLALQATYFNGKNMTGFQGIARGVNETLLTEVDKQGGFVQLQFKPNAKWQINGTLGYEEADSDDLLDGDATENKTALLTVLYNLNKAVTLGVEYQHLSTDYKNAADGDANRIQWSAIYKF